MEKPMGLVHSEPEHFSIIREESNSDFCYRYVSGETIADPDELDRIQSLKIPPNWKKVKICEKAHGHVQAFGYDDKGRKQYTYHDEWVLRQNVAKFDRMPEFAMKLPKIRKRAYRDIDLPGWPKTKVLGLVVLTLDETYLRIGNRQYMNRNQTFGLTTLRRKHLEIANEEVTFQYKGKSRRYRKVNLKNDRLVKLIRKSSELPGYEVFRYRSGESYYSIDSGDLNQYLQDISGFDFSAKDFRTWGGTTLAVECYPEARDEVARNKRKKLSTTLIRNVAVQLGNTVSICRDYYIHPRILEIIESDNPDQLRYQNHRKGKYALAPAEKKALALITEKE